jgi:hypothetical protein
LINIMDQMMMIIMMMIKNRLLLPCKTQKDDHFFLSCLKG